MRETRIQIRVLKGVKVMIFKERFIKKKHSYLSTAFLKKLHRYHNPKQHGDQELCSSNEPNSVESELNQLGETSPKTSNPNNRTYEFNNIELERL